VRPGEGRSSAALLEEPRTGVDSWAWVSVGWLIRSRYMPTRRKKSHLLAYFTLCVCRPGLGSAWAGSLGPGTCLQEKPRILLFIIISSIANILVRKERTNCTYQQNVVLLL
jgi:hypothetical protein